LLKEVMKKQNLPKIIPIFPLSNFIIFPNTTVPLNIFEPRYIEMINDSIKTNKLIGLIQPKKNNINSILDTYETGCLGKITNFKDTADGNYLIELNGLSRFKNGFVKLGWVLLTGVGGILTFLITNALNLFK